MRAFALALASSVFANANAGSKVYIAVTAAAGAIPEPVGETDLLVAEYEALEWTEIKALGDHGEAGSSTNILNYDTWDTKVIQKAKGMTDAGSPTMEVARLPLDPGQKAMRVAAKTNLNYAFKMERNDAPGGVGATGTILYNRGLVTGPTRPFGRNEDFDLEVFTLALNQEEIVVDPVAGT